MTPPSNRAGAPPAPPILHSLDDWLCGGVAARGRAASPTKRGLYCIDVYVLFELRNFGNGTSQLYPSLTIFNAVEDCRTAPLFDSPEPDDLEDPSA